MAKAVVPTQRRKSTVTASIRHVPLGDRVPGDKVEMEANAPSDSKFKVYHHAA